jgi:60 kDa SS-A/Ro ribonucleoprotein
MRFNIFKKAINTVKNYEGAKAYSITPETELYSAVVTSGLSDLHYEKSDNRLKRIIELMNQCSADFIARLAIYTRNQMHLRSISMVLMVELAKRQHTNFSLSNVVPKVVQRADEITELLGYYQIANNRTGVKKLNKLSKQLQKGLGSSFNQFDEYQFAKYNRTAEITLKDALFLVHPKAKDEAQQIIFDKIATDTLAIPYTWETELSLLGQTKFASISEKELAVKMKWEELIDSNKLGYMALMRNLRNIIEANVSANHIDKVCNTLANEKAVLKSKQLPFRYLSAFRELSAIKSRFTAMILDALESAISISASNIKGFDIHTSIVIACDVSGSMQVAVSPKSKILLYDIGLVLGMIMKNRCKNVMAGMFGDTWKIINTGNKSILNNVQEFYKREGEVGYSTNGYKVIDDLVARKEVVDKVMLFTDVQMYDSSLVGNSLEKSWNNYKKMVPNAKLYVFDLAGHGKAPLSLKRNDVFLIAGWSDKIFDVLDAIEQGGNAISKINEIEI